MLVESNRDHVTEDVDVLTKTEKAEMTDLLLTYASVISRLQSDILSSAETSLTYRQFSILRHVRNRCDSITLLKAKARLSLATTSQSVDNLVKRQLLAREPHPNDRRKIVLTLTPSGERAVNEAEELIRKLGLELINAAPAESLDVLRRALPDLIGHARSRMVLS